MISTSCLLDVAQSALSMTPAAGQSRSRAATIASADNAGTVRRQSRASTAPCSGTSSVHPPSSSSATSSRNIGCRSTRAWSTASTSACVTPAGAWITTVWLN